MPNDSGATATGAARAARFSGFVPPVWRILSDGAVGSGTSASRELCIALEPGAGFGSGAHETTQLCLQALYAFQPRPPRPWRLLDFGSGSGILSIAAVKLGASVEAVEIDEQAIQHAERNARLNGVQHDIRFARSLASLPGQFDLVVANIQLGVLNRFAEDLAQRRIRGGGLVLSGLVGTDVPVAIARYEPLLDGERPEVYERGEWRALAWRPRAP